MKKVLIYITLMVALVLVVFIYYKNNDNTNVVNDIAKSTNLVYSTSTTQNNVTKDWLKFNDSENKISFLYPKDLSTSYIHTVDWPPKISVENKKYSCTDISNSVNGQTKSELINGKEYCITKESEGAAGSIYTTYTYKFSFSEKTLVLSLVLRSPQCMNYDDPKQTECINEEKDFDLNDIISRIVNTIN